MPQVFLGTQQESKQEGDFLFIFVLKVSAPRIHTEEPSGVEDARGTVGRGGGTITVWWVRHKPSSLLSVYTAVVSRAKVGFHRGHVEVSGRGLVFVQVLKLDLSVAVGRAGLSAREIIGRYKNEKDISMSWF